MGFKLSIITINLNNLSGLEFTVNSLPNNINFEWIYIDGLSNDGSTEFVESLGRKPDRIIIEKDNGIYDAMNKGIDIATGDYIWFINSGDIICNDLKLDNVIDILKNNDVDLFYGDFILSNKGLHKTIRQNMKLDFPWLINKTLNHQSFILKSDYLKKRKFNLKYRIISDWIQLFETFRFNDINVFYFPSPLVIYDRNGFSYLNEDLRLKEREEYLRLQYSNWELESLSNWSRIRNRSYYDELLKNIDSPWMTRFLHFTLKLRNVFRK